MLCTIDFKEHVVKPKYPSRELGESFRVKTDQNFTVRDIMERFAGGITNNSVFNGAAELQFETQNIPPAEYDDILNAPDVMSANRIDMNDYEDFRTSAYQRDNLRAGDNFQAAQQSSANVTSDPLSAPSTGAPE